MAFSGERILLGITGLRKPVCAPAHKRKLRFLDVVLFSQARVAAARIELPTTFEAGDKGLHPSFGQEYQLQLISRLVLGLQPTELHCDEMAVH